MFELKHIFAMITLVAIWSLAYTIDSAWIGTAIIASTTIAYACLNLEALQKNNMHLTVFTLAGMSWMIFWLGFIAETKRTPPWKVPEAILNVVHFGNPPEYGGMLGPDKIIINSTLHSLHYSGDSAIIKTPDERMVPKFPTAVRLGVAVSSIPFGILLAAICWLSRNFKRRGITKR